MNLLNLLTIKLIIIMKMNELKALTNMKENIKKNN